MLTFSNLPAASYTAQLIEDWNRNGRWDTGEAGTGVFDGRVAMSVSLFENTDQVNAPISRTATIYLDGLRFGGTRFLLRPGDAYLLTLSKPHSPTVFLPPVP